MESCPVRPEAPQEYNGLDLCTPDDQLSNEAKKKRCRDIGSYIIYVATFLEDIISYTKCKIDQIQKMLGRAEVSAIRAENALSEIEILTCDIVIPTEATYDKCAIDEYRCQDINQRLFNRMESTSCCCKPYEKLTM